MNVLIACEESQVECMAFRSKGCNAFSCDLQSCSGGHPEFHVKCDVRLLLSTPCSFYTSDNLLHYIDSWDLIIAHPPCTYLSNAGACRMFSKFCTGKSLLNEDRYKYLLEARDFFFLFLDLSCKHVCIENPTPLKVAALPECSQVIQPYQFGHPYSKRTCLWLKGLPCLFSTLLVDDFVSWTSLSRSPVIRSKSFSGIAAAMADQWVDFLN